jgi:anti-sigma B factor antagonist
MRGCAFTLEQLPSGAVRVGLRGELDLLHAYTFDAELRSVEETAPACIVLDLRELTFMDSCGVGRLVAAQRRARRAGRRLVLVRGGRAVQRLLALTALDEMFETVGEVPPELRRVDAAPVGASSGSRG